jgi:sortase A
MSDASLSAHSPTAQRAEMASLSRPGAPTSLALSRPGSSPLAGNWDMDGGGVSGPPYPRRLSGTNRLIRAGARLLMLFGVLLLLDAGVTLIWQEPFSAISATIKQGDLRRSLQAIERAAPPPVLRHELSRVHVEHQRIALLARALERKARNGSAVGRIEIPRINANFVVVKGTETAALQEGPGIYPDTNFPGIAGTTAIAGHRTTYLAPFRHIDELRPGNHILLDMPYAHFTYTVIGQRSVLPTDVQAAVGNVGYSRLVLSACTPLFSAAERLLVFARLTSAVPVGAAKPARAPRDSPAVLKAKQGLLAPLVP